MTGTGADRSRLVSTALLLGFALLVLSACGTRPGAGVLQTMDGTVEGAQVVTVYTATTREREAANSNVFTSGRADELNYSSFTISVPPNHEPGRIEWPTDRIDPATTFAAIDQRILTGRQFYQRVGAPPSGIESVTIFVHGYNTGFEESLYRLTQMTADAHLEGTPILFAWPSDAGVAGYLADREAVTFSRDAMVRMLTDLAGDRRLERINILAHSMGGWLTVEALRQLRLQGRDDVLDRLSVVLAAPDIDVDVFRAQMQVLGAMEPPLTVLVSPDDRALLVSNRLGGARDRVGALDINDPRVREAAQEANVALVDISSLEAADGFRHNRFVTFATLYPQLAGQRDPDTPGLGIRQAGAFVFNAVGDVLSSPFTLVGGALAGE